MTSLKSVSFVLIALAISVGLACSDRQKAPDVTANIRQSLDQAGLNEVSVSQDRDRNIVTLKGTVANDGDKAQAESLAKSLAGSQVVANEIGVRPAGDETTAKKVDSNLDAAIDKNLEAMLVEHRMNHEVSYDVKNGVVTLKGDVPSPGTRSSVEKMASTVPHVKQVVNELEVKHQKATSTK
jgi:hyperosmotically inducible protein